jgi:hypothetical protein
MLTVTAQQDFSYRDITMTKGEAREVPGMMAVLLKAKGFVAFGTPENIPSAGKKPARKKRTYKRRDMTAA